MCITSTIRFGPDRWPSSKVELAESPKEAYGWLKMAYFADNEGA
jgi:hypothetical protein